MSTHLPKVLITDLDGTLTDAGGTINPCDVHKLRQLGDHNVHRVIATGRHLIGVKKVLGTDFPIDYVVFASGAGVCDWRTGEILYSRQLDRPSVTTLRDKLCAMDLDFMLHFPMPDTHYFVAFPSSTPAEDFCRRRTRLTDYERSSEDLDLLSHATGAVIVRADFPERLTEELKDFSVIRATSPLDNISVWIEIFAHGVNKRNALIALTERLGANLSQCLAIGNDYNDEEMLRWAGAGMVVPGTPASVARGLIPLHRQDSLGLLAEALSKWPPFGI